VLAASSHPIAEEKDAVDNAAASDVDVAEAAFASQ